jgi:hypothetical protein
MQIKLLHAILSGVIIAMVLGLSLIPTTWHVISRENGVREGFSAITDGKAIMGIISSFVVIGITLLSFKMMRRVEE